MVHQLKYGSRKAEFVENQLGDTVFMRLAAPIGYNEKVPYSIIGAQFADEMYFLKSQGLEIIVKINSGGGGVVDMFSIRDAIITCQAGTHNMGLAASAAGIILMSGAYGKRTADDISTFMAHPPMGGDADFRDNLRSQFTREVQKRTKFSQEMVTEFFKEGGKNHWFNAAKQLEYGIIDKIIKTDAQMPRMDMENESEETIYMVYNSIINKTQNEMDFKALKETVAIKLGLKSEATEAEVTNAADKLAADLSSAQSEVARLKLEKTALESKVATLEAEGKVKVENQAKDLIENAIKEKKLVVKDDAEKALYVQMATTNYEGTKSLIGSIKVTTPRSSVTTIIKGDDGKDVKLKYSELANKDPKRLEEIEQNQPELYAQLVNEYHEEQKTKN